MTDMRTVEKIEHGSSTARRVDLNSDVCRRLASRYIALDTETTGLDPEKDRIVELGAVLFEKGIPTNTFRSYVNPGIEISEEVSAINHISNELLQTAPAEKLIYPQLIRFLGDAIDGVNCTQQNGHLYFRGIPIKKTVF